MENNLKKKAKFFAQYWDQKILTGIPIDKPFTFRRLNHQNIQKGIMYSFLELKSLSDITDEDALWFAKHYWIEWFLLNRSDESIIRKTKEVIERNQWAKNSYLIDQFRLRGYAVDWANISVEDQIKYGWIKIKTNE